MEYIKGEITIKNSDYFIFESNQIGYKIYGNWKNIKTNIVYTYVHYDNHLNKQNIFGFNSLKEKEYFLLLLKIRGVGPFSINKIMNHYSPKEIDEIRQSGNYLLLSKSQVKNSILSKIVIKQKDFGKTNIIAVTSSLIKLGFKKDNVHVALQKIYNKNTPLDKLIAKVIKEINHA